MPDDDSNQPRLITIPLGDVKPNPFRDLPNYKLNDDKVRSLMASIGSTGFWANVIGRINGDGDFEIAYGHHRIEAARRVLGPDHRQTFLVQPYSDIVMIRMMADENSDAWSNQVSHADLVVKAARDYLDNLLDQYETLYHLSCVREFASTAELFGNEGNYQNARRDGVGQNIIEGFLAGTFAAGHAVRNALANIELSPKQRAAKEREDAENRKRAAALKAQEAAEKAAMFAEAKAKREAAEQAQREREAGEKERKRLAEEARRNSQWLKRLRENEDRAKAEADAAAAKQAQQELKAAELALQRAEEAERRAEEKAREAREAEDRLLARHEAEAKARQQREEEIRSEIEKLERQETQIAARLAQDGLYDYHAGEVFSVHLHAKTFREIVATERAHKAGIKLEDQARIAQEIVSSYGNSGEPLNSATIRAHLMRIINEAEQVNWRNAERREKVQTLVDKMLRSLRTASAAMREVAGMLGDIEDENPVTVPIMTLHNDLDDLATAKKRLLEAVERRNKSKPPPSLTVIPTPKQKES